MCSNQVQPTTNKCVPKCETPTPPNEMLLLNCTALGGAISRYAFVEHSIFHPVFVCLKKCDSSTSLTRSRQFPNLSFTHPSSVATSDLMSRPANSVRKVTHKEASARAFSSSRKYGCKPESTRSPIKVMSIAITTCSKHRTSSIDCITRAKCSLAPRVRHLNMTETCALRDGQDSEYDRNTCGA